MELWYEELLPPGQGHHEVHGPLVAYLDGWEGAEAHVGNVLTQAGVDPENGHVEGKASLQRERGDHSKLLLWQHGHLTQDSSLCNWTVLAEKVWAAPGLCLVTSIYFGPFLNKNGINSDRKTQF